MTDLAKKQWMINIEYRTLHNAPNACNTHSSLPRVAQLVRLRDRNNLGIFFLIINFSAGLGFVACSSTHIWMAPMNSDTPWTKIYTPALQETVVTDLCISHNHFRTHLINALL
jgi:hypothetical protein